MQLTRITIPITTEEREALRSLAKKELRDPREQVRYLIQQELIRHGRLSTNTESDVNTRQSSHVAFSA